MTDYSVEDNVTTFRESHTTKDTQTPQPVLLHSTFLCVCTTQYAASLRRVSLPFGIYSTYMPRRRTQAVCVLRVFNATYVTVS